MVQLYIVYGCFAFFLLIEMAAIMEKLDTHGRKPNKNQLACSCIFSSWME